jgi:hypothetical protein
MKGSIGDPDTNLSPVKAKDTRKKSDKITFICKSKEDTPEEGENAPAMGRRRRKPAL